jgi:mono/diheme cytochrome c family protein
VNRRDMHTGTISAAAVLVTALIGLVAIGSSATSAASRANQDHEQARESGAYLFRTYCASCHGTTAMGDGPLADVMRRRPTNLTDSARRNGGVFPSELMFRIIDGRQMVRGHGGPDMPVWGDAFRRSLDGSDEESVKRRIQALVTYLDSIQARLGD